MPTFGKRSFVEDLARGEHEVAASDEREVTRRALEKASDNLVDMTVQTPWERHREQASDTAKGSSDSDTPPTSAFGGMEAYHRAIAEGQPWNQPSRSRRIGRLAEQSNRRRY